jgi:dissimilatory sulfite reductase (desulfoviridin) alpha/beta subunit
MSDILVNIMVEVLSVLASSYEADKARSLQYAAHRHIISLIAKLGAEKFAKKLLGESEIEAVIKRLDRLTDEEARMTVAQTLQVVHGLVNNVKVVMDGMQVLSVRCQLLTRIV